MKRYMRSVFGSVPDIKVSQTNIDNFLWDVKSSLMKKYGVDAAERMIDPLVWYVSTGRASSEFLRKLINTKPYVIARKLVENSSVDDTLQRIKTYLRTE